MGGSACIIAGGALTGATVGAAPLGARWGAVACVALVSDAYVTSAGGQQKNRAQNDPSSLG